MSVTISESIVALSFRFEGKQLGMKAAERMRPILEAWVQQKEAEGMPCFKLGKKRRRRTCFTSEAQEVLNEHFLKNPKPTNDDIKFISDQLDLDQTTVRVWFCNRKQALKRQGQVLPDNTVKSELEAKRKRKDDDNVDVNEADSASILGGGFALAATPLKQIIPVTMSTGALATLPFILSQDGGVTIVSTPNQSHGPQVVSQLNLNTSIPQQVVFTQVPILPSLSVVNQGMSGSGLVSGSIPTTQTTHVYNSRPIAHQVLSMQHVHTANNSFGGTPSHSVVHGHSQQSTQVMSSGTSEVLVTDVHTETSSEHSHLDNIDRSIVHHTVDDDDDSLDGHGLGRSLSETVHQEGNEVTDDPDRPLPHSVDGDTNALSRLTQHVDKLNPAVQEVPSR